MGSVDRLTKNMDEKRMAITDEDERVAYDASVKETYDALLKLRRYLLDRKNEYASQISYFKNLPINTTLDRRYLDQMGALDQEIFWLNAMHEILSLEQKIEGVKPSYTGAALENKRQLDEIEQEYLLKETEIFEKVIKLREIFVQINQMPLAMLGANSFWIAKYNAVIEKIKKYNALLPRIRNIVAHAQAAFMNTRWNDFAKQYRDAQKEFERIRSEMKKIQ